jgi:hypothetical protein
MVRMALWQPDLEVGAASRPDLVGSGGGGSFGQHGVRCWASGGVLWRPVVRYGRWLSLPLPLSPRWCLWRLVAFSAARRAVSLTAALSIEGHGQAGPVAPLSEVVACGGRHLGGDLGCGLRWWPFFSSGIGLYGVVIDLLGGGCDMHCGLTLAVSLAGCEAACRRWPMLQRALGRAAEGAIAGEMACRGAGRGGRQW